MRIFLGFDFTNNFISQQNYISLDLLVLGSNQETFTLHFLLKEKLELEVLIKIAVRTVIILLIIINSLTPMTILSHKLDRYYQVTEVTLTGLG